MDVVFYAVIVGLLVLIAIMIFRIVKGPTAYDRLNALGVINADVVILLVIFGFVDGRPEMYIDIAIAYAILGFIGNIIISKYLSKRNGDDN